MSVLPASPTDPLVISENASPADRLAACKSYLQAEMVTLRARHAAGASGLDIAHSRARSIDRMLKQLFDIALARYEATNGKAPVPVSLLALGGYGRNELSPLSDIDVMFLFPTKSKPAAMKEFLEHLTNHILYPL